MTDSAPRDDGDLDGQTLAQVHGERMAATLASARTAAMGLRAPLHIGLLGAGFLVLLSIMGISIWLLGESTRTSERVARTLTVTNLLAELGADLRRAESGQRGFLLTGSGRYLEDYNAVVDEIAPTLQQLQATAGDDEARQNQLADLRPLVEAKLAEMASTIQSAIEGDAATSTALVESDRGLRLMNEIGELLAVMSLAERQLLGARLVAAEETKTQLLVVSMAGILVILFLAALSIFAIRRSTQTIVEAHAALARTNQKLEQRVAERTHDLEEANEEIQRFAYIVGHDLRAPLVNVMGFTSELDALRDQIFAGDGQGAIRPDRRKDDGATDQAEPAVKEEFDEALAFIKSSIAKMDRLIQAILQLSRAGRREFRTEAINLTRLAESIVENFNHRLTQQGAEIEVERLPALASDRFALDQILSNLIDNALKYLRPDVAGRIRLTGRETDDAVQVRAIG